jgi:UDP-3-O-[3-hydroxymyristoyl] glucosamine N-acyltransferase
LPENSEIIFIPVDNPRDTFALVMYSFYPSNPPRGISQTAIIADNCEIGRNVYLGHHVVLGNNVKIGDNTQIHSNVTIYENTSIGSECIIHSGAVIGTDGFGYQKDLDGKYYKFPHIGRVIIENNVEIGSNTCIAKGKLTDTIIKNNVKIGNLSHISHDVSVGENAMITHQVHLGGNTIIDANSWIAPGVILKSGKTIGEHALAGMGAVVLKDVSPFDVVAGIPAKPLKKKNLND